MNKMQNIPEGWEVKKLGEICKIFSGFGFKKSEYSNEGLKLIQIENVRHGYIDTQNCSYLPLSCAEKYKNYILKEGDIIVALNRPITQNKLKIGIVKKNDLPAILYQRVGRCDIAYSCNKLFSFYILRKKIFDYVLTKSIGSDQPFISTVEIKKQKLLLPPLAEQERIAEVLSSWDEGIEKLEKVIYLKEKQKKGLMQKLLSGKTRLKGFSRPWKEVKLGDLGKTFTGLTGKTKDDFGFGYPFITYMNIFSSCKITKNKMGLVDIKNNESQNEVKYGDMFFTTSSETPDEVGMSSVLLFEPKERTYLNSFCFGLRLHNFNTLTPDFASFFFRSVSIREKLNQLAQGATRYNLSKISLLKMIISIPTDVSEQSAIADILSSADREIELLKQKLGLFKQQKKYLMQQLLTGKKRLKIN